MNTAFAAPPPKVQIARRNIVYRTRGGVSHEPITRLMSPPDLGEYLKPFVFLDRIDSGEGLAAPERESFRLHPHSGIATLTWLFEGVADHEDSLGLRGRLDAGAMAWMQAGSGAWHGGGFSGSPRTRGFQLWLALPRATELGEARSRLVDSQELHTEGPVTVLLGRYGDAEGIVAAPVPINCFVLRLRAGENWRYQPAAGHTVAWAAVSAGRLRTPESIVAGELVAFAEGEQGVVFHAVEDTEFMFGSAAKHPHELVLGYHSVHTSEAALEQGEARIRQLGHLLRAQGKA